MRSSDAVVFLVFPGTEVPNYRPVDRQFGSYWLHSSEAGNQAEQTRQAFSYQLSVQARTILDLCGGSGEWSRPYAEAGYNVVLIDPFRGTGDVRLLEYPGQVHGILAAPPCTVFAASGARWPRSEQDILNGLSIADACLRLVTVCQPAWWALENPVGKLRRWLGSPTMMFNPCDFGDPYTKKTLLWGRFTVPQRTPVAPTEGSKMHFLPSSARRERAVTPAGFAKALFDANP
jgi:hypothetical protein